jgi:hypothetical protein
MFSMTFTPGPVEDAPRASHAQCVRRKWMLAQRQILRVHRECRAV